MAWSVNKFTTLTAMTLVTYVGVVGCKTIEQDIAGRGGNSDSILASIDGITDEDKKNMGATKYWLECKDSSSANVRVEGAFEEINGKDEITFDGKKIKDGLKCTLEVRGDENPPDQKIKWHTEPVEAGLYFASSWAEVKDRKLDMKVYKLYSIIPDVPTFKAWVHVKAGDIVEGQAAGRNQPGSKNVTADLFCGDMKLSEIGNYTKNEVLGERLLFTLEVAKMKGIPSCERIEVFDNESKKAFEVKLDTLAIQAEENEEIDLKTTEGAAFPMFWIPAELTVEACVHKLNEINCLVALPEEDSFWFATVKMTKIVGEEVEEQIVVVSNKNFRSNKLKEITLFDIRDGLVQGTFVVLKKEFVAKVTGENAIAFDESFLGLSAAPVSGLKLDIASDLNGFSIANINKLYVHQFAAIDEAELNRHSSAVWMAGFGFQLDSKPYFMMVSGKDPMLRSISQPVSGAFLEFDTLAEDLSSGSEENWMVYQFKGGDMSPDKCSLTTEEAHKEMNARDLSNVANALKIANCKVPMADLAAATNLSSPNYFLWAWQEVEIY